MTVEHIENQIDNGKTMYIATCIRIVKITKKTLDAFRKSGRPLFLDDKSGQGFYIARGRKYEFVLEQTVSVTFE